MINNRNQPAKLGMQRGSQPSGSGHGCWSLNVLANRELTGNPNLEELKTLGRPASKPCFIRKTGNLVHLATSRLAVQKVECAFSWVDVVFSSFNPCSMVSAPSLWGCVFHLFGFQADCVWLISLILASKTISVTIVCCLLPHLDV